MSQARVRMRMERADVPELMARASHAGHPELTTN